MHSPSGGKTLETWDAMIELKQQGKIKYVNHNPVGYGVQTFHSA
jgi:diketogulonate reductase-like aldo/keto reductase